MLLLQYEFCTIIYLKKRQAKRHHAELVIEIGATIPCLAVAPITDIKDIHGSPINAPGLTPTNRAEESATHSNFKHKFQQRYS